MRIVATTVSCGSTTVLEKVVIMASLLFKSSIRTVSCMGDILVQLGRENIQILDNAHIKIWGWITLLDDI